MSVSSMASVAVSRRADLGTGKPPKTPEELAKAAGGTAATENTMTAALKSIATYIPTEVIGLYIAALAAVRSGPDPKQATASIADRAGTLTLPSDSEIGVLVVFAVLTPVIVWLVYAGKVRTAGKKIPFRPNSWPVWEMFAAGAGFIAWAFGLPDSPFVRYSWYNLAWATFVVLAVSTALGLLAPIVQRTIKS